jgi:hypothetical protein
VLWYYSTRVLQSRLKKYLRTNFYAHKQYLTVYTCILDRRTFTRTAIIYLLTPGSLTDELLGAQPLCTKFSTHRSYVFKPGGVLNPRNKSTAEKVVLALELFYKLVKCWTRAKRLDFLHKRQVEYGGLCNDKPVLPGFVW